MAKNLYRVLEASEQASPETLKLLFEQKKLQLQAAVDNGNPSAKELLWALNNAYETLSDPEERAVHDRQLKSQANPSATRRATVQTQEPSNWKTSAILLALLATGLIGFGLHLGRANKKDDTAVQMLNVVRTTDNDATRAGTERVFVEGTLRNQEKAIDTHGQIANRVVAVQESAEFRKSRELEYEANAGAEQLRQQQERTRMANEQMQWERKQHEQAAAAQQSRARIASDRMSSINIMIADGRLPEARAYASTSDEMAVVASAERAANQRKRRY